MKNQIETLAKGLKMCAYPSSSDMILSTTFIYIVELLGDSRTLLDLFVKLILTCEEDYRTWVLHSEETGNIDAPSLRESAIRDSQFREEHLGGVGSGHHLGGQHELQLSQHMKTNKDQYYYLIKSDKSLKYKTQINSAII
jgi:hypothetical protein